MPTVQPQSGAGGPTNDQLDRLAKIIESAYDKASTCSKVILGLGYAALFAVWSGSKSDLSEHQRVLSALLATSSLVSYVLFEISQMIVVSSLHWGFSKRVERHSGNLGAA